MIEYYEIKPQSIQEDFSEISFFDDQEAHPCQENEAQTAKWIYERSPDNGSRFALGQIVNPGGKTLLCFGINPSYACPENLDPTIRKVINISRYNGYENWIMLNIYPQRATDPDDMHIICDECLVRENILHIENIISEFRDFDVWLAYGNLISKRSYLKECLVEIVTLLKNTNRSKIKIIKLTKQNNPVHPLYQLNQSPLIDYDFNTDTCSV